MVFCWQNSDTEEQMFLICAHSGMCSCVKTNRRWGYLGKKSQRDCCACCELQQSVQLACVLFAGSLVTFCVCLCLSVYLSIHLFVCLSLSLCVCVSISVSLSLSSP